jgi:hypothetical protein
VIGSETAGGVRNVVASNIVSKGTEIGIRIKSGRGRGGVVENLRFDNWVIDSPLKDGIQVTNYYTRIPAESVSDRTPVFRNIAISNVTVSGAPVVVSVEGLPEMPIAGLRITDLIGSGKRGLEAFNTKGLELHNLRIDSSDGPAFLIRDSADLELDHSTPSIRLDRCAGARVDGPAKLSAEPGSLKSIIFDPSRVTASESSIDSWKDINSPDK